MTEKRLYLGKDDRRRQLLQAAADLVERDGWSGLSMSSLADSTGVSRQLIYQHFPNLEALLSATSWAVFVGTQQGTQQAILANPTDIRAAIQAAAKVTLELPAGQGDALWQLVAGLDLGMPELETIRVGIRDVILSLWVPSIQKVRELDDKSAKALVWMMIMAFWGVRNLIRDKVVSREQGLRHLDEVVKGIIQRPEG